LPWAFPHAKGKARKDKGNANAKMQLQMQGRMAHVLPLAAIHRRFLAQTESMIKSGQSDLLPPIGH
jgi:hypothetical protein